MLSILATLTLLAAGSATLFSQATANPNPLGLSKRASADNTVVLNAVDNYW